MRYHFKIHKEGTEFWAECIEIPGCLTQGDSKEELFTNMQEALNVYLEEPETSKHLAALPQKNIKLSASIVEVPVCPEIALGFSIRYHRIKNGLTQKQAANFLGMKNIFSYQRLEKRCNVTIEMISKILDLFPELSLDNVLK